MKSLYCSSMICPRLRNPDLPYRVPAGELSQDEAGYPWCNHCEMQRRLMNWAHAHRWPAVRVQGQGRYAIWGDASEWFTSVAGANADMVSALYETLIERKREQLSPIEIKPPEEGKGEEKHGN